MTGEYSRQLNIAMNAYPEVLRDKETDCTRGESNLYEMLVADYWSTFYKLFPHAAGKVDWFGGSIDLDAMAEIAAARFETDRARGCHPKGLLYRVLYDTFWVSQVGYSLVHYARHATPADMIEHFAIKVQRLGARQLSIQTALERICQFLHQETCKEISQDPCFLTGVNP